MGMTTCNPRLKITYEQLELAEERPKVLPKLPHPGETGSVVVAQEPKQIKLTPLKYGKVAIVDASDYESVSKFRWMLRNKKHLYYAYRLMPSAAEHEEYAQEEKYDRTPKGNYVPSCA